METTRHGVMSDIVWQLVGSDCPPGEVVRTRLALLPSSVHPPDSLELIKEALADAYDYAVDVLTNPSKGSTALALASDRLKDKQARIALLHQCREEALAAYDGYAARVTSQQADAAKARERCRAALEDIVRRTAADLLSEGRTKATTLAEEVERRRPDLVRLLERDLAHERLVAVCHTTLMEST
jgi:hypothetical protein